MFQIAYGRSLTFGSQITDNDYFGHIGRQEVEYLILELRKAFVREIKIVFCCLIVYRLALHQSIATDEKHLKIVYRDLGLSADRKIGTGSGYDIFQGKSHTLWGVITDPGPVLVLVAGRERHRCHSGQRK